LVELTQSDFHLTTNHHQISKATRESIINKLC
jgi:hypothetical protein